jgi:hypothetical protein
VIFRFSDGGGWRLELHYFHYFQGNGEIMKHLARTLVPLCMALAAPAAFAANGQVQPMAPAVAAPQQMMPQYPFFPFPFPQLQYQGAPQQYMPSYPAQVMPQQYGYMPYPMPANMDPKVLEAIRGVILSGQNAGAAATKANESAAKAETAAKAAGEVVDRASAFTHTAAQGMAEFAKTANEVVAAGQKADQAAKAASEAAARAEAMTAKVQALTDRAAQGMAAFAQSASTVAAVGVRAAEAANKAEQSAARAMELISKAEATLKELDARLQQLSVAPAAATTAAPVATKVAPAAVVPTKVEVAPGLQAEVTPLPATTKPGRKYTSGRKYTGKRK